MSDPMSFLAGKTGRLALVGAVMALALLGAVGQRAMALSGAREILMLSEAVDPRALLVGHYAVLNLSPREMTVSEAESKRLREGARVYLRLTPGAEKGQWLASAPSLTRPQASAGEVIARAKITAITTITDETGANPTRTVSFAFGPDRIYLSQAEAEAVEKATRRMWIEPAAPGPDGEPAPEPAQKPVYAILAVTSAGDVWITGVELDGERLEARW